MSKRPSTNGPDGDGGEGRDGRGRFAKGNRGGPGNPHAGRVGELRKALLNAISTDMVERAVEALAREAESGNVQAIRELLDRAVGKPIEADLIERLESLERELAQREEVKPWG